MALDLSQKIKELQESEDKHSEEGLERLKEALKNYEGEDKLVWWSEIRSRLENEPKKPLHKTGIEELDTAIGGFREKQLVVVAGDSGHGKTLTGMNFLHLLSDLSPIMIPLEQSAEELIEQRIENGYSVPNILSPDNLATRKTVAWIEERIVEGIAKFNTKLVLIDHLGYIDNEGEGGKNKRENLAYRVGEVMRDLKDIAKRWDIVIILLVHISQHDEGLPPSRKDIKNSSDIIQECDIAIFVWRKNAMKNKVRIYENKTLLSVQKNRRSGKNVNVGLEFDPDTGWYKEESTWVKSMEEAAWRQVHAEDNPDDF